MNICIDMDGVLCDFVSAALRVIGSAKTHDEITDWNFFENEQLTESEFWSAISYRGKDFWANLCPYPWALDLIRLVEQYDPDFLIVTQPGKNRLTSCQGKLEWVNKHLSPKYLSKVRFSFSDEGGKSRYMLNKGDFLIDDNIGHIDQWAAAGGTVFLFKQPWNSSPPFENLGALENYLLICEHSRKDSRTSNPKFGVDSDGRFIWPDDTPVRFTDDKTGGQKDQKMCRLDLVPPGPLKILAMVYGYGATKYADNNYRKGYPWSKSIAAMERHIQEFKSGQDIDPESGMPHIGHAAWHTFTLMSFYDEHPDKDDRFRPGN